MKNSKANRQIELPKVKVDEVIDLYSAGNIQEAINKIKELNEDYPNVPLLFNILGACYKALGQIDAAATMFKTAFTIKLDYAEAHFNYGVCQKIMGNNESAVESYKNAVNFLPNYPDAHNNLGNVLRALGRFKEAIESYEWATAYRPEFAEAFNNLGIVFKDMDETDMAMSNFEKAIKLRPNFVDAIFNVAIINKELGNQELSEHNLEKVIELDPEHVNAYRNLSRMKTYKKNDIHIAQMENVLEKEGLSMSDSIGLCFALSKAYEDLGNQDKQFEYLNKGNRQRKKELNYSFDQSLSLHNSIKSVFESPLPKIKKTDYSSSKFTPIFILGMPRSGTSLVEQIISSHDEVFGAGELCSLSEILTPIINDDLESISKEVSLTIRDKYFSMLEKLNISEFFVTDKMPANFRFIGFILSAFPEAKIVHVERDARATCWSMYKYYFDSKGIGFSCDQNDLANYYGLYVDLMDFWHTLFPNKIYDISYENLTSNQEDETKKLLEYCGLDWDEKCLNFHKNKRIVKTTSALQVRQKIYQGSSDVWKRYEKNLQPLIKGLSSY